MWETQFNPIFGPGPLALVEACCGRPIRTLDEFTAALEPTLMRQRQLGVLGVKLFKQVIGPEPPRDDVAPIFDQLLASPDPVSPRSLVESGTRALRDYVGHAIIRAAGSAGLRVMFHSGTRGDGVDFRPTNPKLHVPLFLGYPEVAFEIYHCGMPWVREAGMIAMSYPNVYLNMCWTQSIPPRLACSALAEWLNYVPANKIIAYGDDSAYWLEHSVGDLVLTRMTIATALADRIAVGETTEARAVDLARMMLFRNAVELYGLGEVGDLTYC